MEFAAEQIAELLNGTVVGDPSVKVNNISKIEEGQPNTLTFLSNPKYSKYIYTTAASVVIVNNSFAPEKKIAATLIKVEDAYQAVAKLMQMYEASKPRKTGIEAQSFISKSASIGDFPYIGAFVCIGDNVKIGNNVSISPNSVIGDNVSIGDNTIIHASVNIYNDCVIGNNCIIHSGAVIGSDGFGFAPNAAGEFDKIPQLGNVIIEDNCEIGAQTTIDRATMGSTILRKGVKLDNLVQIAHNVEVGKNCVLAAQSGVAGSSKVGENCMFGGLVSISGHITIANNTKIGGRSGVYSSVKKEGQIIKGVPAFDAKDHNKSLIGFKRLPELIKQVRELEQEIKILKNK